MAYRLRSEGLSYNEIGQKMGVKGPTIAAFIKKAAGKGFKVEYFRSVDGEERPEKPAVAAWRIKRDIRNGIRCRDCWLMLDDTVDCTPDECGSRRASLNRAYLLSLCRLQVAVGLGRNVRSNRECKKYESNNCADMAEADDNGTDTETGRELSRVVSGA
jgi:hypothetical protein